MDNSLTRPQLIHQWIEAEKEQNRIAGLHVNQVLVNQTQEKVETAFSLIRRAQAEGWIDETGRIIRGDDEDIEDAEIVDDETP
jgi:hypothetical protein